MVQCHGTLNQDQVETPVKTIILEQHSVPSVPSAVNGNQEVVDFINRHMPTKDDRNGEDVAQIGTEARSVVQNVNPILTPVEYTVAVGCSWVYVRRCPGMKRIGLPDLPGWWYVHRRFGSEKYWRDDVGWFQHSPTRFETPEEAAAAFLWATRNVSESF